MERETNGDDDSCVIPALIICSLKIPGICCPAMDKVKQFLQQRQRDSSHLVVIGSSDLAERSRTAFEFFVQLFRHHGLHRNERVTVLGAVDQLIAVQLVLASQNKKILGDFSVDNSHVLHINDRLTRWKMSTAADNLEISSDCQEDCNFSEFVQQYSDFLQHCNVVDWMDVANCVATELGADSELQKCLVTSDFLVFCNEDDLIERHFIQLLAKQKKCFNLSVALSLNESFSDKLIPESADLTIEGCPVHEALSSLSTCTQSSTSMSEMLAEQVIVAYLELLVNSRNELALARVINVPDRKLDHAAFTDIKHEAEYRNMSMYQTVLSFIMRIRLGGKSYAPASDCPLVQYTEGLGSFNDLMQKLQTVVEDEVVPEFAVEKVVRILKLRIAKSSIQLIRSAALDVIAARLMDKVTMILKMTSAFPSASPITDARSGGSIVGRRTLRLIRSVLDHCNSLPTRLRNADVLSDVFSTSQKTPVRLPSLISKFRSPEDCHESRTIKQPLEELGAKSRPKLSIHDRSHVTPSIRDCPAGILTERTMNSTNCLIASDKPSEDRTSCQPVQKNSEHSIRKFSTDENDSESNATPSKQPKISNNNENPQEKNKKLCSNAPKKPVKKTGKAKVIPLAKGQQKLNAFFRI